jgi:Icc-related predicted phosphoesterase
VRTADRADPLLPRPGHPRRRATEIYPVLGSYLLAEAIDAGKADLAIHAHAHAGTEHGMTVGGVKVRNAAQPVLRRAFAVYHLDTPAPG